MLGPVKQRLGKAARRLGLRLLRRGPALLVPLLACGVAGANPQGPQVISGSVQFATPNTQTLEITNSPAAIINWNSFNIGVGETTRFIQQNAASAVLNRVTQPGASALLGNLESNGRVFLINPTGIIIGRDAVVDTAGLVLSTLDISNEDFLAGRFEFSGGPDSGDITNHGYIKTAPGGEVILIAPSILNAPLEGNENSGLIETPGGELLLAAGYNISITSLDDPAISFEVSAPAGEVVNLGRLLAEGGTASIIAGTIRHSGELNADSLAVDASGRIVLRATESIQATADSSISASGGDSAAGGSISIAAVPAASEAPQQEPDIQLAGRIDATGTTGGSIDVTGAGVQVGGDIDVSGSTGAGTVDILGDEIALAGASVQANAVEADGGRIRVGGDLQGQGELRRATRTTVDAASTLSASAADSGDGGQVIIWSDDYTAFQGSANARAGDFAGNGGFVEVSGKETLQFAGSADVGAPAGTPGTLMLDPRNIFIVAGGAETSATDGTPFAGDRLGASGISVLGNGNILVVNQDADVAGLVDAGEILLFDPLGGLIGSVGGNAANERLGSFGSLTNVEGNRLFRSPNASAGGLAQAGAVLLFDIDNGVELGRTSGISANELFGQTVSSISGNFVVRSSGADVGGLTNAGSVAVVDGLTGNLLGRVNGASNSELFGQSVSFFSTAPDTFLVRASGADVGGLVDAGKVVLMSALTGQELGRVSGGAAGDQFGAVVDFFGVPSGTFLVRAAAADTGGLTDNGTAVLVNNATGLEIGRTSGLASGDFLGQRAPILRASGNYFLQVTDATVGGNAFAGSLVLVNGATGTRIGSLDGNSVNEDLGFDIDTFTLGSSDVLVTSERHANGALANAGGIFVVADVDLGGGNIVRGQTLGGSANEFFGSNGIEFVSGSAFAVASPDADTAGGVDSGSVVLISRSNGTELGRVDGGSANEGLGQFGIDLRGSGNYFIRSPDADPAAVIDAGSVILASGTTGNEIGRVNGDTANERFGSDVELFSLFNDDILVVSPDHGGTAGIVAQLASVDLGGGNILRGSVNGGQAGDLVGIEGVDFPFFNGNYVVRAPDLGVGSSLELGSVFIVDGNTGSELLRVDGIIDGERLGDEVDDFFNGFDDDLLIRSPGHGGNFNGALFFVDNQGNLLNSFTGNVGDEAGTHQLEVASNGNLVLPMPEADTADFDSGAIALFDGSSYAFIGRVDGQSVGEGFGDPSNIELFSLPDPDKFLVFSPNRSISGTGTNEGAVATISATTGALVGEVFGQNPGDSLGEITNIQVLDNDDFLLFNTSAFDASGTLINAGTVVLVDGSTFTEKGGDGLGRVYGQTAQEALGSDNFVFERDNGNYFVRSRFADAGGLLDSGSLYLVDGSTGILIGQADGDTANERFSTSLDTFTLSFTGSDDVIVRSSAGLNGAGTVVQVADVDLGGGNIIRGRVDGSPGGGFAEALGSFSPSVSPDGLHYYLRAPNADAGGIVDSGSLYFVNIATGSLVNRVDGLSNNEFLGQNSPTTGSAGNLFVRSNGNANAGRVLVVSGAGSLIGEAAGNNPGEFFGSNFQFVGNDIWVISPQHNNGGATAAGGIFAIANQDLGGGNIIRRSILGTGANDNLGASGISFVDSDRRLIRVPLADVGGLVDAGTAIMVDLQLNELGRSSGTSAGELYSQTFFTNLGDDRLMFRSPLADIGGNVDAGTVKFVNALTGNLVGETPGGSADERFGNFFPIFLSDGTLLFRSPDADVGGLVDAGAVVQVDPVTGQEIGRTVGLSANERLGALSPIFLGTDRYLFASPDADVDGVVDAGRLVFFDGGGTNVVISPDLLFADNPGTDSIITTGTIEATLATGTTLILQANNDIVFQPGANLFANDGRLVLQAGRTVKFGDSTVIVPGLEIVANESETEGAIATYRSAGTGDVLFDNARVVSTGDFALSGQNIDVLAGDNPDAVYSPTDVSLLFESFFADPLGFSLPAAFALGVRSLDVDAESINLFGSSSAGGFASLVSFGEFTVNADQALFEAGTGDAAHALLLGLGGLGDFVIPNCTGCGDQPIFLDPFLEPLPQTGFFISGLFQEPTIDAILALLNREEASDEADEERDEEEDEGVGECGI